MKRSALFCLYCRKKIILSSDIALISELHSFVDNLTIIVNGDVSNLYLIDDLYDNLITRENEGFDAGAYKSALEDAAIRKEVESSDQLILCNNSFFGPFIPLADIFQRMEKENVSFWGLSSSEKNLIKHIQSYFLVFESDVIKSNLIFQYFDQHIKSDLKYDEVCRLFENGLFRFLEINGFSYSSFSKDISYDSYKNCIGSLVGDSAPVLKRKAFDPTFYDEEKVLAALSYIKSHYSYDISIIIEDANILYDTNICNNGIKEYPNPEIKPDLIQKDFAITRDDLFRYIDDHNNIYIYGTGGTAKHIFNCFFIYEGHPKLAGFIVSDNQEISENETLFGSPIYKYSALDDKHKDIILAVTKENAETVTKALNPQDKVLQLWK